MKIEDFSINAKHKYFITGGNPIINTGGGVIASTNSLDDARSIQKECLMNGYRKVKIMTYDEMMDVDDNSAIA